MELDRTAILDRMQSRAITIDEFNFDRLIAPPLSSLLTMEDIDNLYYIATSVKYSGNARKKYNAIDQILKPRGFTKLGSGTNRVVYKFLEDDTFVIKVAADAVGIKDNPREFINQSIFKPFVTKVFEVDPTGVVAVVERVLPITSREEFISIGNDVYDAITTWFLGKYVMADIGTKFFMNWGTRRGFGPVLLDFPYAYELDGNKLYCSAPNSESSTGLCGGEIDYDDGFNFLHCMKCGVQYRVRELSKAIKDETVIVKGNRRKSKMKVAVKRYGTLISQVEENIVKEEVTKIVKEETVDVKPVGNLKVSVRKVDKPNNVRYNNNKPYNKNNKKNRNNKNNRYNDNYNGNNRGVVYDTTTNQKEVAVETTSEKSYTMEELSQLSYDYCSYDAENALLILKAKNSDLRICLDLTTIDKETFDVFFEQSDYMIELETAKKDLIDREEALEAEKEANNSLSESADILNKGLDDLQNTIDALDKDLAAKDDEIIELKKTIEELNKTSDDVAEKTDPDKMVVTTSFIEEKDNEIEKLNNVILEMTEEITNLNTEIESHYEDVKELANLKQELESEKAKAVTQEEDYKAKISALEEMLNNANEKIEALSEDEIPTIDEEIDFDNYEGFSCIHGVTTSFNNIIGNEEDGFEEDHQVIAFPDGSGSFIRDVEDNIIVAVSINDTSLDAVKFVSRPDYDAYKKAKASKSTPVGVTQQ